MRPSLHLAAATLASILSLACSSQSPPAESPARTGAAQAGPVSPAPSSTPLATDEPAPPRKGCACQLKLKPAPVSRAHAETSALSGDLPTPPFDLERRSTCTAPVCRLDGWLPDASFVNTTREGVPSQGAVWLETLADKSTLVLPASTELESLALVLEGKVAYGEGERSKSASAPVLSAWGALRARSAGYFLSARDGKASVLIAVLSRSGSLTEALERSKSKSAARPEKATLEVTDLATSHKLGWDNGTNLARVAFGSHPGAASGASLVLLQASGHGQIPETVHSAEWEHIAFLRGGGDLLLGNARYPVSPGAIFHVPRGTLHGWKGSGDELLAVAIFSPGGPEQRFVQAAAKEQPIAPVRPNP